MQITQCPKCNGTFIINKNEIQMDLYDYKFCFIDASDMEGDDGYDRLQALSDYDFYMICKDTGCIYDNTTEFIAAINDGEIYLDDNYVARLIHKDNCKLKVPKNRSQKHKNKAEIDLAELFDNIIKKG